MEATAAVDFETVSHCFDECVQKRGIKCTNAWFQIPFFCGRAKEVLVHWVEGSINTNNCFKVVKLELVGSIVSALHEYVLS